MPTISFTDFESNQTLSDMAYDAENMTSQNESFRVENFSYKNQIMMDTMFKNLEKTDFLGVSVRNFICCFGGGGGQSLPLYT